MRGDLSRVRMTLIYNLAALNTANYASNCTSACRLRVLNTFPHSFTAEAASDTTQSDHRKMFATNIGQFVEQRKGTLIRLRFVCTRSVQFIQLKTFDRGNIARY